MVLARRPRIFQRRLSWERAQTDYSLQKRSNLWLLHEALARDETDVVLIALWNGEDDGPGGTSEMVTLARDRGVKVVVLETQKIFDLR